MNNRSIPYFISIHLFSHSILLLFFLPEAQHESKGQKVTKIRTKTRVRAIISNIYIKINHILSSFINN